ncbi:MAG: class I SAM-dependent methyltransferase [Planctomycetes bacterium]|nr:class I SAM-dependent methyltransferase [Planctomycetota bacterium]
MPHRLPRGVDRARACEGQVNARPQRRYRLDFRQLVLAERPASLLDIGCGGGSLLRWFAKGGVHAEGLDPDPAAVRALGDAGYRARVGRAETLPFADGAFDVVAAEFSAHHFEDLGRALAEAQRVARRAVWLLDPWYDESLGSQRLMLRWDRWFKRIDRRQGMVHNEVLAVADFVAALKDVAPERLEFRHWLRLVPVDLAWFDRESAEHGTLASPEELEELAAVRAEAERDGLTDDGAIVVRIAVG